MTKVIFLRLSPWIDIIYPHPQDIPYAYDVAQAAAFLDPARHEITFIDGMAEKLSEEDIINKIIVVNPDILALSATSSSAHFASDICGRIRRILPRTYILCFGQHAHYSPQSFLNKSLHVDACVYGEPELTLVELIQQMPKSRAEKEKIKGIYYWDNELRNTAERPLVADLDQWPLPRYEIFKKRDYRIVSINFPVFRNMKPGWILATRGCPYQCSICSPSIRRSFGTQLRRISPKRAVDTFRLLEDTLGVNTIYFGDDAFTLDMEWAEAVCDELIRRKSRINWGMGTRVDRLSSGLIKKMKAAGLRSVALGVESGSERVLKDINKKITLQQINWAISEFTKNRISINVTAIVGHVDETPAELKETFSLLKRSKVFFVQLHYLSPYPGTKVAQVFKDRFKNLGDISHYNAAPMNVSKIPDKMLSGSVQKFYLKYYASWNFAKKYLTRRMPYTLTNPLKELKLVKESLAYFLLSKRTKKMNDKKRNVFVPRQSISIRWPEFFKAFFLLSCKSGCGKDVLAWEKKFAEFVGVPHAISFISERAGTYFTLRALKEMNKWETPEIICPSYTFFSVPWAVKLAGWNLRLADISEDDLNLNPQSMERQITKDTKAVILTHLNGKPAKMAEIERIAKKHNLRILEDCAHTIGVESDGKQVGAWDIGCFSFGDGKNLGTFGGGMITTSDQKLAAMLREKVSTFIPQSKIKILRRITDSLILKVLTTGIFYPLFLYPLLRWFGYLSADSRKQDFLYFYNNTKEKNLTFKFSDLQAIMGLNQLKYLEKRNEIRRGNSRAFRGHLSQKTLAKMLTWDGKEPHAMLHDYIMLDCGLEAARESLKMGIDVRLDYCGNCRDLPGLEDCPGEDKVGKKVNMKVLFIPNHLGMNPEQSKMIAVALDNLFKRKKYV